MSRNVASHPEEGRMRTVAAAITLALAGCATTPHSPAAAPACELSAEDHAWIDGALSAWRFTANEITGATAARPFDAVFFDDDCVLTSENAFAAANAADVAWTATP